MRSGWVYTTFMEIGVDFNTGLVEKIAKVRGANYYSVHSAREFAERILKHKRNGISSRVG